MSGWRADERENGQIERMIEERINIQVRKRTRVANTEFLKEPYRKHGCPDPF